MTPEDQLTCLCRAKGWRLARKAAWPNRWWIKSQDGFWHPKLQRMDANVVFDTAESALSYFISGKHIPPHDLP